MSPLYEPPIVFPFDAQTLTVGNLPTVTIPRTGTFPGAFNYFEFRYISRESPTGGSGLNQTAFLHFSINGDTTAGHHGDAFFQGFAGSTSSFGNATETSNLSDIRTGIQVGSGAAAGLWAVGYAQCIRYADTRLNKQFLMMSSAIPKSDLAAGQGIFMIGGGVYYSTVAVTSVLVGMTAGFTNFAIGTTFLSYLWG